MVILVRGTAESDNYSDRILTAMASTAMQRYSKSVLVLQFTSKHPVEKVLIGKRLASGNIRNMEYSFEDTGMDALLRRIETGHMNNEQFSDCCHNVSKNMNGFDIAGITKRNDFTEYLLNNEGPVRELVRNAETIYDIVFLLADAENETLLKRLEELCEQEVVCIPQGPKKEIIAKQDCYYAVKNFDKLSSFTIKNMARTYGSKNVYPIPYNILFKDACLNEFALSFLTMNVSPDETDENYFFTESLSVLVGTLLGMTEPVIKEHNFVLKKQSSKDKKTL